MTEERPVGGERPDDGDIDAQFEAIVRNLRAEETGRARQQRWPGTGQAPAEPPNPPPADFDGSAQPPESGPPRPADPLQGAPTTDDPHEPPATTPHEPPATWREWVDPEVEEHFIPPDPPPLPAGDLHFWGIIVGLIGGPLLLLLAHGFKVLHGDVWTWLGLILSVGGFALLILRTPKDRGPDDYSDGAQV